MKTMRRMATRLGAAGMGAIVLLAIMLLALSPARADDPVGAHPAVTDPGAPAIVRTPGAGAAAGERAATRRPPTRIRVYRSFPGPNAVRQCVAHYEQEFRPAGTVIVPRMQCWWEG